MISVLFTTYCSPECLQKVLWGYEIQTYRDFEVIIAEDGATAGVRKLIDKMRLEVHYPIKHVWHTRKGFRKCEILNKAILVSEGEYILFAGGDCIPRMDFVEVHNRNREKGYFLSGGFAELSERVSVVLDKEKIRDQLCFQYEWLKKQGERMTVKKKLKLSANSKSRAYLNLLTPTKATWNGHNSSGWKKDILAINGFDEQMRYGAEDREFGERLVNNGIRPKQIRYSAICVQLNYGQEQREEENPLRSAVIRRATYREGRTWTKYGIKK